MSDKWFYMKGKNTFGPINAHDLKKLAAIGELRPSDQLWNEGMDSWVPASKVKGLFPSVQKITPPTPPLQPAPSLVRTCNLTCPHCSRLIGSFFAYPGQTVNCPHCGVQITPPEAMQLSAVLEPVLPRTTKNTNNPHNIKLPPVPSNMPSHRSTPKWVMLTATKLWIPLCIAAYFAGSYIRKETILNNAGVMDNGYLLYHYDVMSPRQLDALGVLAGVCCVLGVTLVYGITIFVSLVFWFAGDESHRGNGPKT
jgi:hypothetical protein